MGIVVAFGSSPPFPGFRGHVSMTCISLDHGYASTVIIAFD